MALTSEQVKELKEQLISQVQHLPEPKKSEAIKQIETLSPQALETMLKQQGKEKSSEKIFRLVVSGEIPSEKLDENKSAIAVLEINPISKAHSLIIPKEPVTDPKKLPKSAISLAKKLSKKIISKLKAKSAEIQPEKKFGEVIINVIPVYDSPLTLDSPRHKAEKSELEEISQKLKTKQKPKIEKIKKSTQQLEIIKLPRKIP